jgi:protein-disulfide isomerase
MRALSVSLAATMALALPLALSGAAFAADPAPALDKKAIEKIVHDYILENPEVLTEAIAVLQSREEEKARKESEQAVKESQKDLYASKSSPVGGNLKGDITMVEFFDYQCGYCKATQPELDAAIKADGKVKLIYKEFPILGPASLVAAKAALASHKQGKYEAFHTALMTNKARLDDALIFKIAADTGLNTDKLKADMESDAVKKEIDDNMALAQKLGINGTPGFTIGSKVVPGAVKQDRLKDLFKEARSAG